MKLNLPDYYGIKNKKKISPKKYTTDEKKILKSLVVDNKMTYNEIVKVSENIMRKIYAHGDTSKSTQEFVEKHPELKNKSWKEKRKALKKRFPYLTYKEIDYLHKISKANLK